MRLSRDDCVLAVIDIQDRLFPAIADADAVLDRARLVGRAATRLGVPVIVTEQYPKGLGPTLPAMREAVPGAWRVEKTWFSAAADPMAAPAFDNGPRHTAVLVGTEAHVCVLQTAMDLKAAGRRVVMVADAVGSRVPADKAAALDRARSQGIEIVTAEMAAFEWLERSATAEFKDVITWIR